MTSVATANVSSGSRMYRCMTGLLRCGGWPLSRFSTGSRRRVATPDRLSGTYWTDPPPGNLKDDLRPTRRQLLPPSSNAAGQGEPPGPPIASGLSAIGISSTQRGSPLSRRQMRRVFGSWLASSATGHGTKADLIRQGQGGVVSPTLPAVHRSHPRFRARQ